ncbi:MAG: nucleoside triphosphate pyrophosphohydrolase, partial [Candidatus Promineifilaceae bacterium]
MAAEQGEFQLGDVIAAINAKLKRRHPHVWGDIAVADSAEVLRNWEQLKRDERLAGAEAASWLDNVPFALPALARAQKMQQRARKVGFDWGSAAGPRAKILEELQEVESATDQAERRAELGDLLFSLVNWARWLDVDAETALRGSNSRFEQRFRRVEQLAASRGQKLSELGLEALDALWEQSKAGLAAEAGGQGAAGEREVR